MHWQWVARIWVKVGLGKKSKRLGQGRPGLTQGGLVRQQRQLVRAWLVATGARAGSRADTRHKPGSGLLNHRVTMPAGRGCRPAAPPSVFGCRCPTRATCTARTAAALAVRRWRHRRRRRQHLSPRRWQAACLRSCCLSWRGAVVMKCCCLRWLTAAAAALPRTWTHQWSRSGSHLCGPEPGPRRRPPDRRRG